MEKPFRLETIDRTQISDYRKFGRENYGHGLKRLRFNFKIWRAKRAAFRLLKRTLKEKEAWFGPFKGEFGHFLGHNLPFIAWLYSEGVQVHYCGLDIQKPFLVDENGKSIVHKFYPLRDFFKEVEPDSNEVLAPGDVEAQITAFKTAARESGQPFWDLSDGFFYWFIMRTQMVLPPRMKVFDLSQVYGKGKKEKSVVIFPRKKGGDDTPNNGQSWDFQELAEAVSPYFDKVYVCGHPALSAGVEAKGNIELYLNGNNQEILEKCSVSPLIITQHSGTNYLGKYTNSDTLLIYKPKGHILGIEDTLYFRHNLKNEDDMDYAWSLEEVVDYCQKYSSNL